MAFRGTEHEARGFVYDASVVRSLQRLAVSASLCAALGCGNGDSGADVVGQDGAASPDVGPDVATDAVSVEADVRGDGSETLDVGGETPTDAVSSLNRIFLMHVQPPMAPHTQPYSVLGYFADTVIVSCQWGPCFVDVATGAVHWDIVTNSEYPGEGRYPGPLVDHHGCCQNMAVRGSELFVLNNGTETTFPGNTLVYSLPAGDFVRVYDSAADFTGDMGAQTTDPSGFTWKVATENATFTPSFRVDYYLYRADYVP